MKKLLCLIFSVLAFSVGAEQAPRNVSIGQIVSLRSEILKQQKDIWVYVPSHSAAKEFGEARFPVVYLLDGNDHFHVVQALLRFHCEANWNPKCPKMILVGVTHQDRNWELTPSKAGWMRSPDKINEGTGGGETFTAFLAQELIPYIDAHYPTVPYRTLVGHSFGGLFAMNTLTHHTDLFQSYVALDPTMWWEKQKLLQQTVQALDAKALDRAELYVALANNLPTGMKLEDALQDSRPETMMMRSNFILKKAIERNAHMHARVSYYPSEDHDSLTLLAQYEAIKFLFDFYPVPDANLYLDEKFDGIPRLRKHFAEVSRRLGYAVPISGNFVDDLGQYFLWRKSFEKAREYFELNQSNFPKHPKVLESWGDYYSAKGEPQQALEYFKQALQYGAPDSIRSKMDKITEAALRSKD